jgi:BirA family biotin operon repressor/biotin-[acetyl-CoA-carboxylase] ligase
MTDDLARAASDFPDPFRLLVRETAASTNDELRAMAEKGAPHGLVLLALEQTAGRGRRGAAWFSSSGESLALSILLRPDEPKALWPRLALAAGLSVAEAIESFGPAAGIKWPNDVWIGRRKVAGILVEAGKDFAVVGIGINVNTTAFPHEIEKIATSLFLETGTNPQRGDVLSAMIRHIARRTRQIGGDFDHLLDSIRQRCVLTGQQVSLGTPTGPRHGRVMGIAPGGELLLHTENGLERLMQADEVRILG